MKDLYTACRALYESAFGSDPKAWNDALFCHVMPDHLRVIREGDRPLSMLFSIPYPIKTAQGAIEARYLYAVATDPAYRGKGLARQLLQSVASEGYPVFLRPSSQSLFGFYQKAGFSPISPMLTLEGRAEGGDFSGLTQLSVSEYLAARAQFLKPPYAEPTPAFLSLGFLHGGAVLGRSEFVAFFERHGSCIYFKEWLGATDQAPRVAAFLGGERYRLRTPCAQGTPFGVGINTPPSLAFSIALD